MLDTPLQKGEPVEIHALAINAERAWMKGYSFGYVEPSGDVIVTHTDGPFEGAPVRMPAERVRRALPFYRAHEVVHLCGRGAMWQPHTIVTRGLPSREVEQLASEVVTRAPLYGVMP